MRLLAATVSVLLVAAACENDTVNRPFSNVPVDRLFERYVSLGNSITAGYQSDGILDSTQLRAYPVLLAQAMRSPFFPPLMARPGCRPPFTNVFTNTRFTPPGFPTSTASSCYLRAIPATPPPYISNTAVPGATVISAYNNLDPAANSNNLTTFFLGGLTQVQMAAKAQPTFVSVWIGNNDVLGAALSGGDTTLITSVTTFQTRYGAMLDSLDSIRPRGGVLIGVANVVLVADRAPIPPTQLPANGVPYFSYGSTYYTLAALGQLGPFTAAPTCAPPRGDSVLVSFPFGSGLVGTGGNLTCLETQTVQPAEVVKFMTTVTAYNTYIAGQAAARGYAYLDPNSTLDSLRRIPTQVAFFPNFGPPTARTPCSASPFGLAYSCDAIHPSTSTHVLIARKLRDAINGAYATAIPPIP